MPQGVGTLYTAENPILQTLILEYLFARDGINLKLGPVPPCWEERIFRKAYCDVIHGVLGSLRTEPLEGDTEPEPLEVHTAKNRTCISCW